MALFKNPKPVQLMIGAFIIIFITFLSCESKAETTIEAGATSLNGGFSGGADIFITERWDRKWSVGVGLLGEQTDKYDRHINNNLMLFGQRTVYRKNFYLGLGLAYIGNTTTVNGSNLNYLLSIGYDFNSPWYIVIGHISNGGTHPPNNGQELLNVGYAFY